MWLFPNASINYQKTLLKQCPATKTSQSFGWLNSSSGLWARFVREPAIDRGRRSFAFAGALVAGPFHTNQLWHFRLVCRVHFVKANLENFDRSLFEINYFNNFFTSSFSWWLSFPLPLHSMIEFLSCNDVSWRNISYNKQHAWSTKTEVRTSPSWNEK